MQTMSLEIPQVIGELEPNMAALKRRMIEYLVLDEYQHGKISMLNYEDVIHAYEVDVEFPDVSGVEHLDMLLTRSELAAIEQELTPAQRQRLYHADQRLIEHARHFMKPFDRLPAWSNGGASTMRRSRSGGGISMSSLRWQKSFM